jgi:hypothetical protein
MKKHLVGLVIALLTFCIGILAAKLRPSTVQQKEIIVFEISVTPVEHRRTFAGPWREVRIGRVSFSIPTYLKKTGPPGNAGVIEAFGGALVDQYLYLNYSYGDTISSDVNKPYGQPSERLIDGKPATLYFADVEKQAFNLKDSPVMKLVVLDVGDGRTKFELYLSSFDVELMRQIVDSVQIRS